MKPREAPEITAWLALAESDLRVAQLVAGVEPPMWHQVCFHAQQAAEKALKALVEAHGGFVPRTHDLVRLLELLRPFQAGVDAVMLAAAVLGQYGVGPRYPSIEFVSSEAEARAALGHAEAVVAWALAAFS